MKRFSIAILIFAAALAVCGCAFVYELPPEPTITPELEEPSPEPVETPTPDPIQEFLDGMTLNEKVGQLFVVRPESLALEMTSEQVYAITEDAVTELTESMRDTLRDFPAGGVILFGKNVLNEEQLTAFTAALVHSCRIPLFISTDEEGGDVARIANSKEFTAVKDYKSAADVAKSGEVNDALEMGLTIGEYLKQYGFNMDFAPVADVNTNPKNPIIGDRAFSSDAATASDMAHAMADGLKRQGIIPTYKHFPGHGDTAEDSHSGVAVNKRTKDELLVCEWLPYKTLTDTDCVMVGHIAVPEITGDNTPASLSAEIKLDILRGELGFKGLIISDSLVMGAIVKEYSSGEAAVLAFESGCDLLLCPEDYVAAFRAVADAVESGRIARERLDESVYRILRLKIEYGIL